MRLPDDGIEYKSYTKCAFQELKDKLDKSKKSFLKVCYEQRLIPVLDSVVFLSKQLVSFFEGEESG